MNGLAKITHACCACSDHSDDDAAVYYVCATDAQGRQYQSREMFYFRDAINRALAIEKAQDIGDLDCDIYTPYGSEAWDIEGMECRTIEDERFGYY
jgi:hypothetical protein